MIVDLDQKDLKSGILGLVVALVEIIKETLRRQALRRMEGGSLTEAEIERLGQALMELDAAIEKIKLEMGIAESVKAVRDGLDGAVQDVVDTIVNPWQSQGRPLEGSHGESDRGSRRAQPSH
jgi:hypothetical protein